MSGWTHVDRPRTDSSLRLGGYRVSVQRSVCVGLHGSVRMYVKGVVVSLYRMLHVMPCYLPSHLLPPSLVPAAPQHLRMYISNAARLLKGDTFGLRQATPTLL